ncbi:MAG: type II secretion system F family protein [Candidatus Eremiobacteraeota bacterium]|nr:type II secretion system F family protein [Candidatus Eremiobacteraeota bacterium]
MQPDAVPAVPQWWIAAIYATVAIFAVAVAASAWVAQSSRRVVLARLARRPERGLPGGVAGSGDGEISAARARVSALLARVLPASVHNKATLDRLAQAGYHEPDAVLYYAAARVLAPVLGPLLVLLATGVHTGATDGSNHGPLALGLGLLAGITLPSAILDRKAGTRRTALTLAIPDALDLLIVCLEAGVGLDAALVRVARELQPSHPMLAAELESVTRRVGAGLPRDEALRTLVVRTGVDDMRAIVSTMIQAERLGTSLARVLRIHGESLRTRRKQLAEKRAAQASVKMMIPLVTFLLPAFFIIVLGPAVLSMLASARQ